jgi:hypothetical protein
MAPLLFEKINELDGDYPPRVRAYLDRLMGRSDFARAIKAERLDGARR